MTTFELVNTVDDKDAESDDSASARKRKRSKRQGTDTTEGQIEEQAKQDAVVAAVEYQVKVDGHTAKANSDPVIIIDP